MGNSKHYLNNVICAFDHQFAQAAVEHAIMMGHVTLTYDFADDVAHLSRNYDTLCEEYRKALAENEAKLTQSYKPILKELHHAA